MHLIISCLFFLVKYTQTGKYTQHRFTAQWTFPVQTRVCNHPRDPQTTFPELPSPPLPVGNHCLDLEQQTLILPASALYISGITQYAFFCV